MAENFADAVLEYRYVWIQVRWHRHHGKIAMPPAGLAADGLALPPKIVQVQSPLGWKTVSWKMEKYGQVPTCPSPDSADPNDVLFDDDIAHPISMTDPITDRHYWSLAGEYVYCLLQPLNPKGGLPGIKMPNEIDKRSAAQNSIPGTFFVDYLTALANLTTKTIP